MLSLTLKHAHGLHVKSFNFLSLLGIRANKSEGVSKLTHPHFL